jgi:hypothetical protein
VVAKSKRKSQRLESNVAESVFVLMNGWSKNKGFAKIAQDATWCAGEAPFF